VGVAVFAAMGCLAWGLPAAAQASSSPPVIGNEFVSHITEHDATLEAYIDPNGLKTTYQFRLESGCLPPSVCLAIAPIPLPSGEIAASTGAHQVALDLNSVGVTLHPDTRYRYSVEATSSAGTTEGPGHIFTTSPARAPLVVSESVSNLGPTDATLEAQINTEGLEATYEFHLVGSLCQWPCESPERLFPLPSGKLLGSFIDQSVSLDLNSAGVNLAEENDYAYFVTATSSAGTTEGPLQEFTRPAGVVQPLNTTTPSRTNGNNQGTSSTPTGSGGSGSPAPGVTPLGPQIVCLCNCARGCHAKKLSPEHPTRTQKRSKALKACAKKLKRKRAACEKLAHKNYAAIKR
jgi:hypothetical protein